MAQSGPSESFTVVGDAPSGKVREWFDPYAQIIGNGRTVYVKIVADPAMAVGTIRLSSSARAYLGIGLGTRVSANPVGAIPELESLMLRVDKISGSRPVAQADVWADVVRRQLVYPMKVGQCFSGPYEGNQYQITVTSIDDGVEVGLMSPRTDIEVEGSGVASKPALLKVQAIDPMAFGIGGLGQQIEKLVRDLFLPRMIDSKLIEASGMGEKPVMGAVLCGPPGCGKTLIARKLAHILNCPDPVVVGCAEILDKYVGETEKRVRALAQPAIDHPDRVHVLIFDEFDALCKKRGSGGSIGDMNDRVVNGLLTVFDGFQRINNLIVFATTNRIDLIDEAVMRPGRLQIVLNISLPDAKGRSEIFAIHTKKMRENSLLSRDVNFDELVRLTENYTGAEIEGVVHLAWDLSLSGQIDLKSLDKVSAISSTIVTRDNFLSALSETKPMFGSRDTRADDIIAKGCELKISYTLTHKARYEQIVIEGAPRSGKTTQAVLLASWVAESEKLGYVKLVKPEDFLGMDTRSVIIGLQEIYVKATAAKRAVVVIDDVEDLIGASPDGVRYDGAIVKALIVLAGRDSAEEVVTIFTTRSYTVVKNTGLFDRVDTDRVIRL